jgi:phytoene synthase
MTAMDVNARDVAACRALQKRHGTSYFFATRFLPARHRWAVHALYAFFRVADEIVDAEPVPVGSLDERVAADAACARLRDWQRLWHRVRQGEPTQEPVLRLTNQVFTRYQIPDAYADAFFESMEMDTRKSVYETYEESKAYMYGSAAVVGRMLTHVLGYSSEDAFEKADALGYAMQWTNFLRDIDEDWILRRRVYLPQDRLRAHGLTNEVIASRTWNEALETLMREEVERAHALYREAETGIRFLAPDGRLGVLVAARLYRGILTRIERQGFNPFAGRARTSLAEKTTLAFGAWRDVGTLR